MSVIYCRIHLSIVPAMFRFFFISSQCDVDEIPFIESGKGWSQMCFTSYISFIRKLAINFSDRNLNKHSRHCSCKRIARE